MNRNVFSRVAFVLAVALTTAWAVAVGAYLHHVGLAGVMALAPPELGSLLAAAGGVPAVLWLFMAVIEQRRTIHHLATRFGDVMAANRHSLQQAETQTRALLQLQTAMSYSQSAASRQLALADLAANAAVLAERLGVMTREHTAAAWVRYGAGDATAFVQAFLTFAASHPDIAERMAEAVTRDAVARNALGSFVRRYQRFTQSLADDKMATEVLDEGALGRAFRLFKKADDLAAIESAVSVTAPAAPPDDLFEDDPAARKPELADIRGPRR